MDRKMVGARKVAVTKYQFWHARSPRERILEIHYKVRLLQQKEGFWVWCDIRTLVLQPFQVFDTWNKPVQGL